MGALAKNQLVYVNGGFMYNVGRGVSEDRGEAIKWYRKAAAQGDERAKHNLNFLGK